MNWQDYQVGRRVVCIADFEPAIWAPLYSDFPVKGKIYTIRIAAMKQNGLGQIGLALAFCEFRARGVPGSMLQPRGGEWFFGADEFRPVDERRIDQFRALLAPAPAQSVSA